MTQSKSKSKSKSCYGLYSVLVLLSVLVVFLSAHAEPVGSHLVRVFPDSAGRWTTAGHINGRAVTFRIDLEASTLVISPSEAVRLGIDPSRGVSSPIHTPTGMVFAQRLKLDRVGVGRIELRHIDAVVLPTDNPKTLLLGRSFLDHVQLRQEGQVLVLQQK